MTKMKLSKRDVLIDKEGMKLCLNLKLFILKKKLKNMN